MLKELFDRGKCALGFHSGDWRYASDQRCEQLQICSRCDNQSRQVVHNWRTWQYVASEACDMARWCERCKEQENKTEHVWGAPIYQAAESCEQMRPCSRCGEMVFGVDQTGKEAVSLQMVNSAVQEVMQAGDVDSVRERITRHRSILLSPATEKYFNFAVDQLAANAEAKEAYQKLAGLIDRCRREGVNNVLRPAAPASPPQPAVSTQIGEQPSVKTNSALDRRLIGHWRHTEILGSGSFMRSIDTHCILDGTGAMHWYSRSASGTGAVESGVWSATNGTLDLHFANGNRLAFVYELDGATLFCPREGRYRLWNRIN